MLPATQVLDSASASGVIPEDDKVQYFVKPTSILEKVEPNGCVAVGNAVWKSAASSGITLHVDAYYDEDRVSSKGITDVADDYTSRKGHREHVKSVDEAGRQAGHDRYWQIVSVISCFMSVMYNNAMVSCYGVLYIYIKDSLTVTEYQLSWIGSLMNGFFGMASVLTSVLVGRVGCRYTHLLGGLILASSVIASSQTSNIYILYLTVGILAGIGSSLTFVASMIHLSRQFSRWRPLAIGVASIGGALGSLTWPPLMSGLADVFGWRGALLINGALFLHMLPCALLIKFSPEPPCNKDSTRSDSYKQIVVSLWRKFREQLRTVKVPGFISFCLSYLLIGLGVVSFPTFIPEYVMTSLPGQTASEVALVVSLIGAGNIFGRALFSALCMLSPKSALYLHLILTTLSGLTCFAVVLCQNMVDFYVTAVFYGTAYGGASAVWCPMLIIVFDLENLPKLMGSLLMMQGIGAVCGPPFQSYVADVMALKDLIFYTTGAFFISSILVVLPSLVKKQLVSRQLSRKTDGIRVTGISNKGADLGSTDTGSLHLT